MSERFTPEWIAEQREIIDEYHRIAVPGGDKNKAAITEAAMMSAAWNNYPAALDEIERLNGVNAASLEACKIAFDALINSSKQPNVIRKALDSGELERRLIKLGADVFDPTGRARALLAIRAAIAKAEEGDK